MVRSLSILIALLAGSGFAQASVSTESIENYRVTFEKCYNGNQPWSFGLRRWSFGHREWILLVNPRSLRTQKVEPTSVRCQLLSLRSFLRDSTRYTEQLKVQVNEDFKGENAGIHRPSRDSSGSFLTIDLCPSSKGFDQKFFEDLRDRLGPVPQLNIAVSGKWIEHHSSEFDWLRENERGGRLRIEWFNHSYSHPYARGIPHTENFLLTPGVNFEQEILDNEKVLIANGITPTIFFRFPGLVANKQLMGRLTGLGLIAIGADAWIGKGESPREGSLILVHGNGNEPKGLSGFMNLLAQGRIALPLRSLFDFEF